MRTRFLLLLLIVSVLVSAWGLVIDEAFAGEIPTAPAVEVARRAPLGISAPVWTDGEARPTPIVTEDREPTIESSPSSDSDD